MNHPRLRRFSKLRIFGPKKMRFCLLFLALAVCLPLSAQELSIHLGAVQLQARDLQLSPFNLSNWSGAAGLAYAKNNERRMRRFQLQYTESFLESDISGTFSERSNSTHLYAGQFTHHELWRLPFEPAMLYAGFLGHTTVSYRDHHYIGQATESQYEGIIGLGPAIGWRRPLGKAAELRALGALGALNYIADKGYSPRLFRASQLADWSNFKGPFAFTDWQAELEGRFRLGSRSDLLLGYQFRSYRQGRLQMVFHRILLGITFKWQSDE